MKSYCSVVVCATMLPALTVTSARSQDRGNGRNGQNNQDHPAFTEHDQKVTHDWYNQHRDNAPAGLRDKDKLSPDQESRLRPGAVLDPDLRRNAHPVPRDLSRQLPPPQPNHRYVAVGGHVASVDNHNRVQDVIHLELNF